MKLEDRIKDAIEQNSSVELPQRWDAVREGYVRAHRRRGLARAALGSLSALILVAGGAIASARLGRDNATGFAKNPALRSFRYTATSVYTSPGTEEQTTLYGAGDVDLSRGLHRQIVKDQWETIVSPKHILLRAPDEAIDKWARAPSNIDERVVVGGEDLFGLLENPAGYLDSLRNVADSVKKAGPVQINGEPTTRYDVVIDLDKVLRRAPESSRKFLRTALSTAASRDVTVWVRDDGIAKRVTEQFTLSIGDDTGTARRTWTLGEFDAPMTIDLPPEEQIKDVPSLLSAVMGGGSTSACMTTVSGSAAARIQDGDDPQPAQTTSTKTTCT